MSLVFDGNIANSHTRADFESNQICFPNKVDPQLVQQIKKYTDQLGDDFSLYTTNKAKIFSISISNSASFQPPENPFDVDLALNQHQVIGTINPANYKQSLTSISTGRGQIIQKKNFLSLLTISVSPSLSRV